MSVATGFGVNRGAIAAQPRIKDTRLRQIVVRELRDVVPRCRVSLAAPPQRSPPENDDAVMEYPKRLEVRQHGVISDVISGRLKLGTDDISRSWRVNWRQIYSGAGRGLLACPRLSAEEIRIAAACPCGGHAARRSFGSRFFGLSFDCLVPMRPVSSRTHRTK